jgi:membrane-anchored protein YejM (alkaline phosphatase superfamily)
VGKYKTGENKMYPMVQYTDEALKDLFNNISSKPWFKNTLFVITADHVSSEVTQPQYKTAWGQYAVPVIFYQYGMQSALVKDQVAQQIDILPTVLSYLNFDQPYIAFGKDLLSQSKNEAFNYASLAYQLYLGDSLFRFDGNKPIGLFNYRTDPFLKNNLKVGDRIPFFEKKMKAFIQQYNNRMVENRLIISRD